jgi:hypothetical protein
MKRHFEQEKTEETEIGKGTSVSSVISCSNPSSTSLLLLFIFLLAPVLQACPICLGIVPQQATLADEVRAAESVVIGQPGDAAGVFTVSGVVKGDAALKGTRITMADAKASGATILARTSAVEPWQSLGTAGIHLASFFKVTLDLPAAEPRDDAEWADRLARVQPFLGHRDGRVARSAWAEWARAPYRVVRSQRIEPEKLHAWLLDPGQSYAQPMWNILLGVCGNGDDARRTNEQLETAWKNNDAGLVPALLTARIEREGEAGVAWLEDRYIRDRDRTLEEIQAAIIALSVQGGVHEQLRPRILAAYRTMLAERRPLSGLVARDLAAWSDWSAATHFQGLLASGEPVLPQTRRAISAYLEACRTHSTPATP